MASRGMEGLLRYKIRSCAFLRVRSLVRVAFGVSPTPRAACAYAAVPNHGYRRWREGHASGAGRGNRTLMVSPPRDFESRASTNSAIPALEMPRRGQVRAKL